MNEQKKYVASVGASGVRSLLMGICGLLAYMNVIPESDIDTIVAFTIMAITPLYSMYAKNKALKAEPPKVTK